MTIKVLDFQLNVETFEENQNRLSELIKSMIHAENESLMSRIESETNSENILRDPSLYFYFLGETKKPFTLEQIVVGYLEGLNESEFSFQARSDCNNVIYFPNLGHISDAKDKTVKAVFDPKTRGIKIDSKTSSIEPESELVSSAIKVYSHVPPALSCNSELNLINSINTSIERNQNNLNAALELLKSDANDFYNVISTATKYLAVFDATNQNSFASISSHGAIFINCEGTSQNEIFFLDDISHQAGHVLFNSLTLDTQDFFKYPKETLLVNELSEAAETRTIYDAFHGLFTYTCIMHSLNQCLKGGKLHEGNNRTELLSRLAFNAGKLHLDLNNLYKQDVFTKKGAEMFEQFVSGYKYISREYGSVVNDFKFGNQGYTFNLSKFLELNHSLSSSLI